MEGQKHLSHYLEAIKSVLHTVLRVCPKYLSFLPHNCHGEKTTEKLKVLSQWGGESHAIVSLFPQVVFA